jgi:hypothetical protein
MVALSGMGVMPSCTPASTDHEVVRSEKGVPGSAEAKQNAPDEADTVIEPTPVEEEAEYEHVVGALETYRYWAGQDPDEDMEVLNGEYWSSAHWSKEYTLYLELRFPRAEDFVMGRNFKRLDAWRDLRDGPDWFDPPKHYEVWEGSLGSLYYLHPKKGHIYIFERQF